jgi:hypothetical protein
VRRLSCHHQNRHQGQCQLQHHPAARVGVRDRRKGQRVRAMGPISASLGYRATAKGMFLGLIHFFVFVVTNRRFCRNYRWKLGLCAVSAATVGADGLRRRRLVVGVGHPSSREL